MQNQFNKTIVLVGLMGCGKSAIGKRLAKELGIRFIDSDNFIEEQEKMSITQIFEKYGEDYFRKKEREAIRNIISDNEIKIVSTGGGAFINEETRKVIKDNAISIWIRADFSLLLERVSRKTTRPLLEKGNKAEILRELMNKRYPIYAESDITIDTSNAPHEIMVNKIINAVNEYDK